VEVKAVNRALVYILILFVLLAGIVAGCNDYPRKAEIVNPDPITLDVERWEESQVLGEGMMPQGWGRNWITLDPGETWEFPILVLEEYTFADITLFYKIEIETAYDDGALENPIFWVESKFVQFK
jgi:hypothetical protein